MASILVVEDNVSLGQLYTKFLAYTGATVAQTTSCAQTLQYLSTESIPDIIVLDMTLPDGNGFSILNYLHIQPQFANTKTIMITGNENYRHAK